MPTAASKGKNEKQWNKPDTNEREAHAKNRRNTNRGPQEPPPSGCPSDPEYQRGNEKRSYRMQVRTGIVVPSKVLAENHEDRMGDASAKRASRMPEFSKRFHSLF